VSAGSRLVLLIVLPAVVLGGCARAEDPAPDATRPRSQQVSGASAAELAALKQRAGIEPCPRSDLDPAASSDLPAVTLPCLGGGRQVNLAGLRGKPTLVNVWAQWCRPCREEIPLFQRLHERSASRLRVIGIDLEDPNEAWALAFAAQTGMTYPQLQDLDGAVPDGLRVRGIPLTLFVTPAGRLAYTKLGSIESTAELNRMVEQQLGVSPR
jgi:cytochrome c biogenesis protein CcmG, thiol:disulfide interchange protein DsbE